MLSLSLPPLLFSFIHSTPIKIYITKSFLAKPVLMVHQTHLYSQEVEDSISHYLKYKSINNQVITHTSNLKSSIID